MEVTFESSDVILEDGPFPFEREDRPRSRTWPILPPPIETIHEQECGAEIAEPPPIIEEVEEPPVVSETQKSEANPRKNSRKNAWGNLSYADLITRAIQSSPEQRLTLAQIYEWMVRNIPYFKDKGDSTSSAGWKNSIRHNLSLHSRFMRVQNDNNGKSSYWVINPDAKPGKSPRRSRSGSVDGQPKDNKRRSRGKKLHQSTDDISALSPGSMKFKQNLSYDNLFNVASPCSSTDSLSNIEDYHPYMGESFNRPRSTSNLSTQSSVNGRMTPVQIDIEEDLKQLEQNQLQYGGSGIAEETTSMVESMKIDPTSTTINLDDSMKMMNKQGEQKFSVNDSFIRRPKSDSFGSGDSGYESPAYFSPPQPTNPQIRMNKMPSPNIVPSKPPPPYNPNQQMPGQMRQNQSLQNRSELQVPGYYQQQQQQQASRVNFQTNQAPRLTHPPLTTQQGNFNQQSYPQTQQMRYPSTLPSSAMASYNPYYKGTNIMPVAPNVTINIQQQPFSAQNHPQRTQYYHFQGDIPSDLSQVKLNVFDDQEQLANDLDAIIKDDLLTLQNNNTVTATSQNNFVSYPNPGHNWVR